MLLAAVVVTWATAGLADATLSTSNDPNAQFDQRLNDLFSQEHDSLARMGADGLNDLVVRPEPREGHEPAELQITYTRAWLAQQDIDMSGPAFDCLSQALYFEARGESVKGQFAVAEVILNRVKSPRFPNTVCAVVNQGASVRNACQFSYACDGKPEVIHNTAAYEQVSTVAALMLQGADSDLTKGATYFHTSQVRPSWSGKFYQTASIGLHDFYRP